MSERTGIENTLIEILNRITNLTKHKYTFFVVGEALDKAEWVIHKFLETDSLDVRKRIYQEFCDTYDEYVPLLTNRYSYAITLMSEARSLMELELHNMEEAIKIGSEQ
ncbi:MAG: hypothetical protein SVM80_12040 [Halobacteriota archaeon]|nr:hypothetical protein [Halobacteriota archaeon]